MFSFLTVVKRRRTDHTALPDPTETPLSHLHTYRTSPLAPVTGQRPSPDAAPSRLAYYISGMSSSSNEGSPPSCSNLWLVFRAALRRAFVRDAHNPQNVGLEPQRSR